MLINISKVFLINILQLLSGLILGFLLPSMLTIETYAFIRTYTLYCSYIGLLHFGFLDGLYLKYGGKKINNIDMDSLSMEHSTFILLQTIISIIIIVISFYVGDVTLIIISFSVLPINLFSFYKLFYQAIGNFNQYCKMMLLYILLNLVFNIILVLFFKINNYVYYCICTLLATILVIIKEEINFSKIVKIKLKTNEKMLSLCYRFIKVGIFITIGSLAINFFYSIDQWFVKVFLTVNDFAFYSFAVSLLNVISILVNSVAVTFYNYLCREKNEHKLLIMKRIILIIGFMSLNAYFLICIIVKIFIPSYINSLYIISQTFLTLPFLMIINVFYINLYKSQKKEKSFLITVIKMLIVSFVLNVIALLINNSTFTIAVATTISYYIWYYYSMKDFKFLKDNIFDFEFIIVNTLLFLFAAYGLNDICGFIFYFGFSLFNIIIFIWKNRILHYLRKPKINI